MMALYGIFMNKLAGKSWVRVAVFEELNDAQILEAFLKNGGVEARAHIDKLLRFFCFYARPA